MSMATIPLKENEIRHDWYQSNDKVNISIFIKNAENVKVEFGSRNAKLDFTTKTETETASASASVATAAATDANPRLKEFKFDNFPFEITPSGCSFTVFTSKIELILCKKLAGVKWIGLDASLSQDKQEITQEISCSSTAASVTASGTEQTKIAHSYPSSSKKKSDWSALNKSVVDDKPEGEAALNALFKDIFANGTPETKKAMMKSFVESGGTNLSTNWDEVGKGKVKVTPPDGMVAKPYEK